MKPMSETEMRAYVRVVSALGRFPRTEHEERIVRRSFHFQSALLGEHLRDLWREIRRALRVRAGD